MIDVTHVNKIVLIKYLYRHSKVPGLGFLQYVPGELKNASEFLEPDGTFHLEYIDGRAVHMYCIKIGRACLIPSYWHKHTPEQMAALRREFNI